MAEHVDWTDYIYSSDLLYLIYADESILPILSILFNFNHGYLPDESIAKNETGDTSDINDYSPIAFVTALSKCCILNICQQLIISLIN